MTTAIILIFAVLVPVVITVLIFRAVKKYSTKSYESEKEFKEDLKSNK